MQRWSGAAPLDAWAPPWCLTPPLPAHLPSLNPAEIAAIEGRMTALLAAQHLAERQAVQQGGGGGGGTVLQPGTAARGGAAAAA